VTYFKKRNTLDSIHREALWYKLRRKGTSDNMVKCTKDMYDEIKFCDMCGGNEVTDFIKQFTYPEKIRLTEQVYWL
jgi:hypothetical protein